MPVMQAPTGPIEISDPNNVADLFVNGPFNVLNMGAMVQITFTTARPETGDLFKGNTTPKIRGIVTSRILMPTEMAQQLAKTLGESIAQSAIQAMGAAGRA